MSLNVGSKLGPYEILSSIGAGGMGEVYRARDVRLDRTVAIKVLPAHVADRPDLRLRLEREARAISQLSHPHICNLFDVGHQDGTDFLVMEYLEGETLDQRLRRGALPLDAVLRYGIEIADALESAHRRGLVHRDLKPGNIIITKSGAKLLDFGLARAIADPQLDDTSSLMTETVPPERPLTAEGALVGTVQYMAPEQLEGAQADRRSDIFALGVVLYEMSTGQAAFSGKTRASLIAAILTSEPATISHLQPVLPRGLDHIVHQCLHKDPDQRWQSAHDVKLELEWLREPAAAGPAVISARRNWLWPVAALLLAVLGFLVGLHQHSSAPARSPVYRAALVPPRDHSYDSDGFALSPDGTRFAFTATSADGVTTLWVRSLAEDSSQEFSGTEGAAGPFWSPDSRFVAFFAHSKLKKLDVATGAVQNICSAIFGRGGTWNREGTIVFAPHVGSLLLRVNAGGGEPVPVTKAAGGSGESHRWPLFLPDGRHFIYFVDWSEGRDGLYIGSLDGGDAKLLSHAIRGNVQFSAGHLLYVKDGTLFAQPFDTKELRFSGNAVPVITQDIEQDIGFGNSGFSTSATGSLVYQSRRSYSSQLVWFDRTGKELQTLAPPAAYEPRLSPDERKLAISLDAGNIGHPRVQVLDLVRDTVTSLTTDMEIDGTPVWSPDGSRIAYTYNAGGSSSIRVRSSDGSGESDVIDSGPRMMMNDWSRDGRYLVYMKFSKGLPALWAYDFQQRKAMPTSAAFPGAEAQVSPDGRWLAYTTTTRFGPEVFVQPFPGSGPRVQISNAGGTQSRWRADGKEMYYIGAQKRLMAVSVQVAANALQAGRPVELFQTRMSSARYAMFQYDVSHDGKRFVVNSLPREDAAAPMILLTDWTAR